MFFDMLFQALKQLKQLVNSRIARFLICGVFTAAFNILLLAALIEFFNLRDPLWRNIANFVSIEISVLFSFFVYRTLVWSNSRWIVRKIFRKEIPLYHLSCATSIAVRSLVLFPLLNWLGVNYVINSIMGIAAGSVINYVISDRVVFTEW
jgi:dolichol-phosphate mannosyltransferase